MSDALNVNIRGNDARNYGEGVGAPDANNRGDLCVALSLPPKAEIVRLGKSWDTRIATGSAFTNVAALPTTRAELALYNGDPDAVYVIDRVWFLGITSMAAAGSVALIAQLVAAAAALTNDTAQLITGRTGKDYGGFARRAVAVTTMVASKWDLLKTSQNGGSSTAQIGLAVYAEVDGGYILPYGATFGVNAVASVAVGTSIMGIGWHEMELPLG